MCRCWKRSWVGEAVRIGGQALQDVDVSLRAGEVTCVVGDNGAGKSVFIKMLCGLIRPSDGELSAGRARRRSFRRRVRRER